MYQVLVDYKEIASWLTSIGSLIAAGGVFLVWKQVAAGAKQLADDHDRSRRQMAVQILQKFPEVLGHNRYLSARFVESLNEEQVKKMLAGEEFLVDANQKGRLTRWLGKNTDLKHEPTEVDGGLKLSKELAVELRGEMAEFLNQLELILIPWRHNVADRGMVEEELLFLWVFVKTCG